MARSSDGQEGTHGKGGILQTGAASDGTKWDECRMYN